MTRKDKTSFGLLALILVILAFFLLVSPFFRFGLPHLLRNGFAVGPPGEFLNPLHWHLSPAVLSVGLLYLLWAGIVVWVYRDAERRDQNGVLWALFVLVGNVIGLIIYLILRGTSPERSGSVAAPPVAGTPCPGCGQAVRAEYVACPHCARPLGRDCEGCGRRLEDAWKACPWCGRGVDEV